MFKVGSLGCKMLIVGVIVILLVGVLGNVVGPPIRGEIRAELYHRWALEFEETWNSIDIIGVVENPEGKAHLEIYLRGIISSSNLQEAAIEFYETEIYVLIEMAGRWGFPVEIVIVGFAPVGFESGIATEANVTDIASGETEGFPGTITVPTYMELWEGRGK